LTAVVDALRSIDIVYYLVAAGVLGVVFVSYITIYLPQKHSQRRLRGRGGPDGDGPTDGDAPEGSDEPGAADGGPKQQGFDRRPTTPH